MVSRRLATRAAVVVAAVALSLTGLASAPTAQAVYTDDPQLYAVDARDQTDKERKARSLSALSYNSCLKPYVERQAKAMAKRI